MSVRSYFTPEAQKAVSAAVRAFESHTSAELVIAVRDRSASYRDADYLMGFAFALAGLCVFLFHPAPFRIDYFPLEISVLFIAGSLFSAQVPALKRLFISAKRQDEQVQMAARAAFYEFGISKTRGRTGILVFVSAFEKRVEVLCDFGADEKKLGPAFNEQVQKLRDILRRGQPLDVFLKALEELGPIAGKALPHTGDDIDELANEVRA